MTGEERRAICKQTIESLEYWLRRIIHDTFQKEFGPDYIDAKKQNGDHLISGQIRNKINERRLQEQDRYPRPIDAGLLDHLIDIVCNPEHYKNYFKDALEGAYPDGNAEARTFMQRLIYPRNALSHGNPISVRMVEQVVCYSHDIIDSIKAFYIRIGKEKEYNVPTVIKSTDSFGNTFHYNESTTGYSLRDNPKFHLRPGDTLTIDLEIDPAWEDDQYTLEWRGHEVRGNQKQLILRIEEKHIRDTFVIECRVKSKESWHRFGDFDHNFNCNYRVLPS